MASKFFTDAGETYLKEAAEYLEERCLTIQDTPIQPFATKNHGLSLKDGTSFPLHGWAFMVKGPDGLPDPGKLHLRVCNYPEQALYFVRGKLAQVYSDRPKFLQMFKEEFLHFTRPKSEICHSNVVMLHEKITSAELATKFLELPGLAISGCAGWAKNGKMGPELEHTIKNLAPCTKLLVCFDGDIAYKPGIQEAAKGLKGWIGLLRDDIDVIFLQVPENERGVGWDDWAVEQGDQLAANWAYEILNQTTGVEITDFVPPGYLIQEYQLETKEDRFGAVSAVHTLDNYLRLTKYPKWATLTVDISNQIYDSTDIAAGPQDFDTIVMRFRTWLETSAYRGNGESVRQGYAKDAITMALSNKKISVPLELLSLQEEISHEKAMDAAKTLITKGIKVVGPMSEEDTCKTIIRMARDMVSLWSLDPSIDVQWAGALVGPSGCGKSNFPHSFIEALRDWGYRPRVAKLAKEGPKAELPELYKACRDSLIGVFDEYNPADASAKQVEQNIFTLSTTRTTDMRELYKEFASECTRHSSIFLTTVDTNRGYMRSSKGAGAERRFITMEVQGTIYYDGELTSDRRIIKECGAILLRYGYQLFLQGNDDSATEFSRSLAAQYLSESIVVGKMGAFWARGDLPGAMAKFGEVWMHKEGVLFTMPMMIDLLLPGERLGRQEKIDVKDFVMEHGAKNWGQGRIHKTMKDDRWCVENWEAFCESLIARI